MDEMDELLGEFLVESTENLDRLDREFVELESDPASREILASIFRTVHTIKGTAGFLGFDRLGEVSHAGESLLSRLRDGEMALDAEMTSALLAMVDAIRGMLSQVEATGSDEGGDHSQLVARLESFLGGGTPSPARSDAVDTADTVETDGPAAPAAEPGPAAEPAPGAHGPTAAETSIRVDVTLLDRLMNLVGELVLARNQILQFRGARSDPAFVNTSQQLDLITTELQEGVMKTRMQPIGSVWSKMPRVVRDLAVTCGKRVRLEMEGEETELDRTILEAIKDPLTHLVRNSVDHGLEAPEVRAAAGKPEEGTIRLRAFHEGGQVVIEISDDGAGLDIDRIRARAAARDVVPASQLERMGDREVANLVFAPGFSTAEQVTSVSGRGVGMDVVRTNIEGIGGSVDLQSEPGAGTTLVVRIPLTLAIIPALLVSCAGTRYAIPQVNLVELLRLEADDDGAVHHVAGAPVLRLRGRLLPLLDLRAILGHDPADSTGVRSVVVLQADDRRFGLVVDDINDTEEIVVKPLAPQLGSTVAFAGTTIMGDGAIALILDTIGLAQLGGVLNEQRDRELDAEDPGADDRRGPTTTVVVCAVGQQRVALPLALVDRLEELAPELVERAAGREVVQYRGDLLTLVDLREVLREGSGDTGDAPLQVLVHTSRGRTYGFVVDEIVDIVESAPADGKPGPEPAVEFSAVIGRRVTDVLHVERIIDTVDAPAPALAGGA